EPGAGGGEAGDDGQHNGSLLNSTHDVPLLGAHVLLPPNATSAREPRRALSRIRKLNRTNDLYAAPFSRTTDTLCMEPKSPLVCVRLSFSCPRARRASRRTPRNRQ